MCWNWTTKNYIKVYINIYIINNNSYGIDSFTLSTENSSPIATTNYNPIEFIHSLDNYFGRIQFLEERLHHSHFNYIIVNTYYFISSGEMLYPLYLMGVVLYSYIVSIFKPTLETTVYIYIFIYLY